MGRSVGAVASLICCLAAAPAKAATEPSDLADLSIEQLAQIPVRSASKHEEPLSSAPTALYVITGAEIEASGVNSLPEALRLAPNLDVQQIDASQYTIGARGFNGIQAGNKVLALIDGRSIYTPLGSSIFWNLHFPMLEDIQQIEVISGPGGTLYGPNAVNGVINITTRNAQDTIGTLVRGVVGIQRRTLAARHGFAIGPAGAVRLYADWQQRDGLPQGTGLDIDDDFRAWQAGFRTDFGGQADNFTLQGDLFRTDVDTFSGDGARGHNLLARWTHTVGPSASFQLQGYYDRFKRTFTLAEDSVTTLDAEAQFNLSRGGHELVAGSGVRTTRDRFINNLNIFQLEPNSRRLWVYNAFIQDRFSLTSRLSLIAGIKAERSSFVGWQLLPNLRLAWQPSDQTLLWGAASRAVRTPSRIDRQLVALPLLAQAPDFRSEKLIALEAGYRGQPSSTVTLSVSGFLNFYDDIRTTEFTDGGLPIQLRNGIKGEAYGVEAWGTAQLAEWWRVSLGAVKLWKDFEVKAGRINLSLRNSLGVDPKWQLRGQSQMDLTDRIQLTINGRAVGGLDVEPRIGSYAEVSARLGYRLNDVVEMFVAGHDLLHRTHAENNDPAAGQLAERSIYAGTRLRF